MQAYEVLADTDHTEGRGVDMKRQHIFLVREDAIDWCEAQPDPFGRTDRKWEDRADHSRKYGHMVIVDLEIIESLDDLPEASAHREQKRLAASAWAKLTDDERAAFLAEYGR